MARLVLVFCGRLHLYTICLPAAENYSVTRDRQQRGQRARALSPLPLSQHHQLDTFHDRRYPITYQVKPWFRQVPDEADPMDNCITHLCLHAVDSADLQFVLGVHLGDHSPYKRQTERMDHQVHPSEPLVKKDANT